MSETQEQGRLTETSRAAIGMVENLEDQIAAKNATIAETMGHLGNVLSFFADLDEDDRCKAFVEAMEFYNKNNPDTQVRGEDGFTQIICGTSPLGSTCRKKAFQRIQVLEEIKFNLEKAVKSKPIPWAHDASSRKEASDV